MPQQMEQVDGITISPQIQNCSEPMIAMWLAFFYFLHRDLCCGCVIFVLALKIVYVEDTDNHMAKGIHTLPCWWDYCIPLSDIRLWFRNWTGYWCFVFISLRKVNNLFYVLKKRNEKYPITTKGINGRDI